MCLEEKVIDGVLHWRGNPEDEFKPYTAQELTMMVLEWQRRVAKARDALNRG